MTTKLLKEKNTNRWDGWEEELDRWEDELNGDERLNTYRTGPHGLFIETNDTNFSRVQSWLLTKTKEGQTIAIDAEQNKFTSPQELLKSIQ